MSKNLIILLTLFSALLFALGANAGISVYGKIEPSKMVMGDQARLRYELTQDKAEKVSCPLFTDTVTTGVDLVEVVKPDTVDLGDGRIQVNLEYIVTAFDSGFYFIPAQKFESESEYASSKPLGLVVDRVQVQAESDINPVKDIMNPPFSWAEFFYWAGIVLLVLVVLAAVAYILMKYVFKKKVTIIPHKEEPVIPPYVIALRRLEEIKDSKAWQSDIKGFYTQVTDVIREYIDKQFSINAMELTTDQILELTKRNPEFEQVRAMLKEMLQLSDLVKFAKYIPLEDDNNRSMINAFAFVEKTKPQEVVTDDEAQPQADNVGKEGEV
ncbi:MAG: hypothetical protein MJ009_06480 [Paludibacteraceae bacterium]|nr:hypothetical protein [Paludibacteraceae bacterium]